MARPTQSTMQTRRSRSQPRASLEMEVSRNRRNASVTNDLRSNASMQSPLRPITQRNEDKADEMAVSSEISQGVGNAENVREEEPQVEEDNEEDLNDDDEVADEDIQPSPKKALHSYMFDENHRLTRRRGSQEPQKHFFSGRVIQERPEIQFDEGDDNIFLDKQKNGRLKRNLRKAGDASAVAEEDEAETSSKRPVSSSSSSSALPNTRSRRRKAPSDNRLQDIVKQIVQQREGDNEIDSDEENEGDEEDEEDAVAEASQMNKNGKNGKNAEGEGEFEVEIYVGSIEAEKKKTEERKRLRREAENAKKNAGKEKEKNTPLFRAEAGEDSDELMEDSDVDSDGETVRKKAETNASTKGHRYTIGRNNIGRTKWTDEETDCLLNSLESIMTGDDQNAKIRPYYAILKSHGPKGTENTILAAKNNMQLKDKVRNEILRRKRAKLEVPDWLDARFRTI